VVRSFACSGLSPIPSEAKKALPSAGAAVAMTGSGGEFDNIGTLWALGRNTEISVKAYLITTGIVA